MGSKDQREVVSDREGSCLKLEREKSNRTLDILARTRLRLRIRFVLGRPAGAQHSITDKMALLLHMKYTS